MRPPIRAYLFDEVQIDVFTKNVCMFFKKATYIGCAHKNMVKIYSRDIH